MYSSVQKESSSLNKPELDPADLSNNKKTPKTFNDLPTDENTGRQKLVPKDRPSFTRSARIPSSSGVENKLQGEGNKPPLPKEKPKAGGWMKLLRKMSTKEDSDSCEEVAADLADNDLDAPEDRPQKQKQVAAVRLPSAVSGTAWTGVVAEFKGRSVENETEDNIETMNF